MIPRNWLFLTTVRVEIGILIKFVNSMTAFRARNLAACPLAEPRFAQLKVKEEDFQSNGT